MKKLLFSLLVFIFFPCAASSERALGGHELGLRTRSVSSREEQAEGTQDFGLSFLAGLLTNKLLLGGEPQHQRAYVLGEKIAQDHNPLIKERITWATVKLNEDFINLTHVMACFNGVAQKAKANFFAEDADPGAEARIEGWLIASIKDVKLP